METAIGIVIQVLMLLATLTAYALLISEVLPKHLLKLNFNVSKYLGRGLERFTYPDGRAVTYEPHPSVRKYVGKYALFTLDGYKYLQLRVDSGVNSYTAKVIMYDNKNAIIDMLTVTENLASATDSSPIRLHHRTSYVAIVLESVNKVDLKPESYLNMKVRDVVVYFIGVFFVTLFEFMHVVGAFNAINGMAAKINASNIQYSTAFAPAFVAGLACVAITVGTRMKKGVKVVM